MNIQPAQPIVFEGAERDVELNVDDIVRRGHRRKRAVPAVIGAGSVIVVLAVTGAVVGLSAGNSSVKDRPLASAAGLFPQRVFANNAFGGPKNQMPVRLVAAAAQVPGRQTFTWTIPKVQSGSGWLYVYCTGGRVSVQFGGAMTGGRCHGLSGVTGSPGAPFGSQTITVRVGTRQASRWGVALYRGGISVPLPHPRH